VVWWKHRFRCPDPACPILSWSISDHRIAAKDCQLTTRCAKWATEQVGKGRSVDEVADELHCGWHQVNNAVMTYGEALLRLDKKRLNKTTALGLDETSFVKMANSQRQYVTTVCDVENHQLIDILPTRDVVDVTRWIRNKPVQWRKRIKQAALDMSNAYAAVLSVALPHATQVVDRFHAIQLANRALDDVRRRVQVEQLGHRGRKDDPLYRIRRSLLTGEERLSPTAAARIEALLALGDPDAEVAMAHRVKEALRDFYTLENPDDARDHLEALISRCLKREMSPEIQRLGRTLKRWFEKLCNWHRIRISNGPTEGLNNLIKRIKRIGFGFTNFRNYRIRALLYAGKPNWRLLRSVVVT
jgi:transposase